MAFQNNRSDPFNSVEMGRNVEQWDKLDGRPSLSSVANDSIHESSFWLARQSLSGQALPSNLSEGDPQVNLRRLMEEVDNELLELIGLEQQMHSISLKCRSIRERMVFKSNAMHVLMDKISVNPKQTVQKQTQTEFAVVTTKDESRADPLSNKRSILHNSKIPLASPGMSPIRPKRRSFTIATTSEPQRELSESLKKRFQRLPALIKGYLTRRLMKTDKVLLEIKSIRGTRHVLSNWDSSPMDQKDKDFRRNLSLHLDKSYQTLYQIFFKYPKSEQMAMISNLRNNIKDGLFKNGVPLSEYCRYDRTPRSTATTSAPKKPIPRKKTKSTATENESRPAKVLCNSSAKMANNRSVGTPVASRVTRSAAQRNHKL